MTNDEQKKLFKASVLPAVTLLTLLLCCFAFAGKSLGWFIYNGDVNSSAGSVELQNINISAEYSFDGAAWFPFDQNSSLGVDVLFNKPQNSGIRPSDKATIMIRFTNLSDFDLTVTEFGLCTKSASDETPIEVGGVKYYFGSQIAAAEGGIESVNEDSMRLYNQADGSTVLTLSAAPYDFKRGSFVVYTVSFLFVNSETEDQNMYQGFGTESVGGVCARRFFIRYNKQ